MKNSKQNDVGIFLAVFVLVCMVGGLFAWVIWNDVENARLDETWTVAAEGAYDHADYGYFDRVFHNSHGSDWSKRIEVTVVYFDDGRTCVAEARLDMSFPKGTFVVIERNGLGRFRLQKK